MLIAYQFPILSNLFNRIALPVSADVAAAVRTIYEESKLDELIDTAATCASLEAFQQHLAR